MMALITERDQSVGREAVDRVIRSRPKEFEGVELGAFPKLALAVAAEITQERHRVLKVIEDAAPGVTPDKLADLLKQLRRGE